MIFKNNEFDADAYPRIAHGESQCQHRLCTVPGAYRDTDTDKGSGITPSPKKISEISVTHFTLSCAIAVTPQAHEKNLKLVVPANCYRLSFDCFKHVQVLSIMLQL